MNKLFFIFLFTQTKKKMMKIFSCIIILLASFIHLFHTQNEHVNKRLRYHFSETYGGMSWSFVDYPFSRSPQMNTQIRIKRIFITYTSERVVALKLLLSDFRLRISPIFYCPLKKKFYSN